MKESIQELFDSRDYRNLRWALREQELADIAEVCSSLERREALSFFRLVPRGRHSDLFAHLNFDTQEMLLEDLPDEIAVPLLNKMEPDDRTKVLEELQEDLRHKLLLKLDPEERQVASQLLSYPEYSVGRLMTSDFLALFQDMRVNQALNHIHWNTSSLPVAYLNHLFVTNKSGELLGEVSLASLVVCDPPTKKVGEIMQKTKVSLLPGQESTEAIEIFRKYDRLYIPVVDENQKILGTISADDVFDLAEEEATEDIQQFGGQGALEEAYLETPFLTILKKRAGWLVFLFITGFISGEVIRHYEDSLTKWTFLVFFLPMITSAGGNSGSQAASLIIRSLAINELSAKDVWRVLGRECLVGLSLGVMLGTIGYLRAMTWRHSLALGGVIFSSVLFIVLFGVIAGSMLPFFFRKIKLDPAVVSSPFISTLMDMTGVFILFNMAIQWMDG